MERNDAIAALQKMNPEEYPTLYRELHIRKDALLRRLVQIIELGQRFPDWAWYPAAVEELIKQYRGSASTWQACKTYLVTVGLLEVRRPTGESMTKAMRESVKRAGKGRKTVLWYRVPDYTPERLQAAEQAAARYKAKGVNRTGLTIQGVIVAQGQDTAKKRLADWRKRSHKDRAAEYEIIRQIQIAIRRKGYATKDGIIQRAAKITARVEKVDFIEALYYVRRVWTNRNKRLLSRARAHYGRPTKQQKEQFHLKGNGWIITPA